MQSSVSDKVRKTHGIKFKLEKITIKKKEKQREKKLHKDVSNVIASQKHCAHYLQLQAHASVCLDVRPEIRRIMCNTIDMVFYQNSISKKTGD